MEKWYDIGMETKKKPGCEITIDLDAFKEMFFRFLDVHRFGKMRVFLDKKEKPKPKPRFSHDPSKTPTWIIQREDLLLISEIHQRLVKDLSSAEVPADNPEKSEDFLIYIGGCIVSKVIMLIHSLLVSYNYYKIRTLPYPGRNPSNYLNPEIVPDLKDALTITVFVLFTNRDLHPFRRTAILSELYSVMKVFFDVLNGMLPCDEVSELRKAYDAFHMSNGANDTIPTFLRQLQAVSRRFADEEPKWEVERVQSNCTCPTPNIENIDFFTVLATTGKRPRLTNPVDFAASVFEVSKNTIINWDNGTGRPPEYPGRDVSEDVLRAQAEKYFLRIHNTKQAIQNHNEGLTHKSKDPHTADYGHDSVIRVQKNAGIIP